MLFATALILSLTATATLGIGLGACPEPKVQKDFDLEKFSGTWYEIESSASVDKIAKKCSSYVIEKKSKTKGRVLHKYVSVLSGKTKTEYSDMLTPKASEPAKLQISPLKGTVLARNYPLWIIASDYENYAVVYTCQKKVFSYVESATILCRNKKMEDKMKMDLYDILKKNDINQKNLVEVDQEDEKCAE